MKLSKLAGLAWGEGVRLLRTSAEQGQGVASANILKQHHTMMHHHDTDLSQVAVYGLFYNASGADDLNLYVWFEIEGEHVSTSTVKGNPGSSVEWPTENLRFKHQHSTAANLQVC